MVTNTFFSLSFRQYVYVRKENDKAELINQIMLITHILI